MCIGANQAPNNPKRETYVELTAEQKERDLIFQDYLDEYLKTLLTGKAENALEAKRKLFECVDTFIKGARKDVIGKVRTDVDNGVEYNHKNYKVYKITTEQVYAYLKYWEDKLVDKNSNEQNN